jgi:NADH/NAD ratio-sensing transcriptional regulator Rex
LKDENIPVTSETLGSYLGTSGDSIRRDIGCLIPKEGKGHYEKRPLAEEIAQAFGFEEPLKICLVGLGILGQYMLQTMDQWDHAKIVLLFDTKINRLERLDQSIPAFPAWEIPEILPSRGIKTAVLATEAEEAEKNASRLFSGGVKYLLNLTGYYLRSPHGGIRIKNINLLSELLCLKATLQNQRKE